MKNPKITVYVVSHNYGRYLQDAIESVLRQSMGDWELLIFDDNSTDNTADVMKLYDGDDRIRMYSTKGIGLPSVCNRALAESRGDYIIRLDGDDAFDENILLVLENYLAKNPDCAMVFPDFFLMDEDGEIYSHERREKIRMTNYILDMPANGACSLIRKEIFMKLGGYREDLGAQDGFDLWNKLKGQYKVANINLPLFYYRRHHDNLTNKTHKISFARQQIKYDNIRKKLDCYRPIIAVIPCRKKYDFCPDLWKQEVNGKMLLQWSIEKCVASSIYDHIVVVSDNPEVETVLSLYDDDRLKYIHRSSEDTRRSKSVASTLEKVVNQLDFNANGLTVISYIETPFARVETLEESVFSLLLDNSDCAMGVEELRDPLFKREGHGLKALNPAKGVSTDFDIVYRESHTSLATRNYNFQAGSLTGASIVNFIVSKDESFFINTELKLKIAKIIAEEVVSLSQQFLKINA